MARVVRKVSSKAVASQKKKGIFKNKLFWIIASVVLVIGLAVGITLGIVLNQDSESEGNTIDYFALREDTDFEKGSYASVSNYTNLNYDNPQNSNSLFKENVFIFAYDLSSFYPDSADSDNYNENHKIVLDRLVDLQAQINAVNAANEDLDIALYIVDTSVGQNASLVYDAAFGGNTELTDATGQFLFSYIQHGELKSDEMLFGANDKKYSLCSMDLDDIITTRIPQAINFVKAELIEL